MCTIYFAKGVGRVDIWESVRLPACVVIAGWKGRKCDYSILYTECPEYVRLLERDEARVSDDYDVFKHLTAELSVTLGGNE